MPSNSKPLYERLAKSQSATIGDVLDEMGFHHQILSADIRAIGPNMKVAGSAFCIKGQTAVGSTVEISGDGPKPGYEMFRHMYEGCVAVMDTGRHYLGGPWGENTALSARARGCIGVVIDGGTRDGQELIDMDFPTFAKFTTAARVEGRWTHVGFEIPITMPGQTCKEVVVQPGDLIVADADGVVVVPKDLAEEVIEAAEEVTRIEELMREKLMRGVDREKVYKEYKRYAHIKRIKG
jgi:regulator of RNase E activity RraA